MGTHIPVNRPLLNGNEKKYLAECIDTGWISSEGPFVERLENEFAARVGRRYGIAVSNGSAAIDLAVTALDIKAGDEVIVPTLTIISCISQLLRVGAVPVFVDCEPETWNIDVLQIERLITPKTKAIMVVHIYGLPCDMKPILELAERYQLKIIEDAAEAHGQSYHGRKCGSFGQISTFSFYPNKHVTTGEGGIILTDDELIAESCRSLRNLCFQQDRRFVHERLGWNMRMSNLQAAVGVAQLEQLDFFISLKREMGRRYSEAFQTLPNVRLPKDEVSYAKNHYWVYPMVLNGDYRKTASQIMRELSELGIGTRPFFYPLHQQPVLPKHRGTDNVLANADYAAEYGFYLPSGLGLTADELDAVVHAVIKVLA